MSDPTKHTVLLVDDDAAILKTLKYILKRSGFNVLTATSGQQALEIVKDTIPSIFLLDIVMPKMSGFSLCKTLKQDPRLKDVPIVFVSGKIVDKDIKNSIELGASDCITKPFFPSEITVRLNTQIQIAEYKKKLRQLNRPEP
jgi:PleD family two-component response regulator